MTNKELSLLIVGVAMQYKGQKEKEGNNIGFLDPTFEAKLKKCGWEKGQSWCAYFAELVYKEAYNMLSAQFTEETLLTQSEIGANIEICRFQIAKYFSGGSLQTFANFDKSEWSTRKPYPEVGAIVIWQKGSTWEGHTGIVISYNEKDNTLTTIDGNTNNDGSRNGNIVTIKTRKFKTPFTHGGLNIKGFIQPMNPSAMTKEMYKPIAIKDKILLETF